MNNSLDKKLTITDRLYLAISMAAKWHEGQYRQGGDKIPYASHPFAVAMILSKYTNDEDVIVAGLLHDVVEDVGVEYADRIKDLFGERVLSFVLEVSEPKMLDGVPLPWEERKRIYNEGLTHDSEEALLISAADHIHNWSSVVSATKRGEDQSKLFNRDTSTRMKNFEEVCSIILSRLRNDITTELRCVLEEARELYN